MNIDKLVIYDLSTYPENPIDFEGYLLRYTVNNIVDLVFVPGDFGLETFQNKTYVIRAIDSEGAESFGVASDYTKYNVYFLERMKIIELEKEQCIEEDDCFRGEDINLFKRYYESMKIALKFHHFDTAKILMETLDEKFTYSNPFGNTRSVGLITRNDKVCD